MRTRMFVAAYVFLMLVIGLTAWLGHVNHNQIKGLIAAQTGNRVSNVYTWCGGINQDRETMRAIAALYHVVYTLPDLDCKKLAATTEASAHR